MLQVLLSHVPVRGEMDRAALAVHSTMLEHGFVCVGTSEPSSSAQPVMTASADGSASLQVLPPGWNSFEDSYAFFYMHPFRQNEDSFTVKAVGIGSSLAVHAASSAPNADLLETKLSVSQDAVDNDPVSVAARAKAWQEKVAVGVAQRLLSRHNSTARLGTALEAAPSEKAGTKRPAPEEPRREPPRHEERRPSQGIPQPPLLQDPFRPGFLGDRPIWWMPEGGLLGPRHPAWGQVAPGRSGGMMPRFDVIGPGEPDPDHFVPGGVPGFPGGLPTFHGGRPGGRGSGMDPDGIFFM
mmetsp:Transcript_2256/g.4650  ORF Transcript_2256/g.4650 Transcript_2256/m.4650 type:complete len:296 (+) Transcript_2256:97-984(+)